MIGIRAAAWGHNPNSIVTNRPDDRIHLESKTEKFQQATIIVPAHATPALTIAGAELAKYLKKMHPGLKIKTTANASELKQQNIIGAAIYLGKSLEIRRYFKNAIDLPVDEEAFAVRQLINDGKIYGAYIAGGSDRAVLSGVYQLLENLGCGFYQSVEFVPPGESGGLDLSQWRLADSALIKERFMFAWPNFLTGCSGWDKADWMKWVVQSQKQGVNTVMVHAYPNDPVFTYQFNGVRKPVGYWPNSSIGRGWGNTNINDVRRMPSGDVISTGPVFGSEFSMVTGDKRIAVAQKAMYDVFEAARMRDMQVNFAFDFDKPNAFPKELLNTFKKSELIGVAPNPETPRGFLFYKAQIEGLLHAYPQLNTITLWYSTGVFTSIKTEMFPATWKMEYDNLCRKDDRVRQLGKNGTTMFLVNKLAVAYRKAIDQLGRKDVRLAFGSWYHHNSEWMEAAARVLPKEINIISLDYSILTNQSMMMNRDSLKTFQKWSHGRIMPVIWNQHDDGGYLGKPSHMVPDFEDRLKQLNAPGFGMIHWMIRPYDLFFKWHNRQVWANSANESLEKTARRMAADWCGAANADIIGKYLTLWAKDAPSVGRGTHETFFYHGWNEGVFNASELIALCKERLELLAKADISAMTIRQKEWLKYFQLFEQFLIAFCDAQDLMQKANLLITAHKYNEASKLLEKINGPSVIEDYAKMVRLVPDDQGQKAMVLRLGYAWYGELVCLRQMAGIEPVRMCFGRTIPEPLANGGTYYNDFFDKDGKMWRQYGENELPGYSTVDNSTISAKQKNIPVALKEIGRQGLLIKHSLDSFIIRAINKGFEYSWNRGELRPGEYDATLLVRRKSPGTNPVHFNIAISKDAKSDSMIVSKDVALPGSNDVELVPVRLKLSLPEKGKAYLHIKLEQGDDLVLCGILLSFESGGSSAIKKAAIVD